MDIKEPDLTFWQKHSNAFIIFIVNRFDLVYTIPFYLLPRIFKTGAGYSGKDKGIAISWFGLMYQIRKPIHERSNIINKL